MRGEGQEGRHEPSEVEEDAIGPGPRGIRPFRYHASWGTWLGHPFGPLCTRVRGRGSTASLSAVSLSDVAFGPLLTNLGVF